MEQLPVDNQVSAFRCLIVDDSEFARKNIGHIIASLGGTIIGEASNGNEAVNMYGRLRPDLVLMDITMPELDGVSALRTILAIDEAAKVIVVSSVGHKEMIWQALCIGAKHYVTKPYAPDYAGMIIQSVIRGNSGRAA